MKKKVSLFLLAAILGAADTLTLKDGSTINGRFLSSNGISIRFATGSQANSFDLDDIDSIRFGKLPIGVVRSDAPSATSARQIAPVRAATPAVPQGFTIRPGYQLLVRLADPVDSKRDQPGQTYHASLEQPITVNGAVAIPRGADVVAVLRDEQQSGRITGKTSLTIALRSVTVAGKSYDLATSTVNKSISSRTARSGEVIGGTAALGAIVGALAGGGRGAGIGAASGAGLGTIAEVATSGQRVRIPSETVLTFTLANPLEIGTN